MVDGIDIRSLDLNWLRSNIGLVVQEPVMFNGTITENIKFGNPNATVSQVGQVQRQTNCLTLAISEYH
jgi:ABC-type multidrug transport system fused ATPase/permease subunit